MASIVNKAASTSTSNGFSTGSLSWTAGSRGLVAVATAGDGSPPTAHTVTGGGVTWTPLGSTPYGARRFLQFFGSDGTPSTGALTITASGGGTFQETMWSVDELQNPDTSPFANTNTVADASPGVTSLNAPAVGTIGTDDIVYAVAGFENGADSFAWAAGVNGLAYQSGGANVRSLRTGFSTTDDTPGVTWSSASYHAGILAILLEGVAGGSSPATLSSPASSSVSASGATVGATTDQSTGTLHAVLSTSDNVSAATATQVIAGQNSGGTSATAAGNAAISTTSPSAAFSGLTASTTYYYAIAQTNANGNSNVVSGSFTTSAASSTVTDVDTDEAITATQTNVVITGTVLGATQSSGGVTLRQGGRSVAQSIDSWSATSIQIDVVQGTSPGIPYGSADLRVTTGTGATADLPVSVTAPSGKNYVNLSGTLAASGSRITAVSDLVAGDQLEWSNVVGGVVGDVTVNADGSFTAASGVSAFDVRAWDSSDGSWGATATQTVGEPATVPTITALAQAAAETAITAAGLVVGTISTANHASVPTGYVISQSPTAGTATIAGTSVAFTVSLGPVMVTVPNVVNATQASATSSITGAGLIVGSVSNAASTTIVVGNVISQSPAAGSSVATGSAVNLTVSTGVSVPNVVNTAQASAESAITGASLAVGTVSTANHASIAAGNVISQSPAAGSSVNGGSAVSIVVSLGPAAGPPTLSSPTPTGTIGTTTTATVGASTNQSSGTLYLLVSTINLGSPAAGYVKENYDTIVSVVSGTPSFGYTGLSPSTLYYAYAVQETASGDSAVLEWTFTTAAPAMATVPNVVSLTQAAASTAITGAGLTVGTVTSASSPTVPSGSVISQSLTAGSSVAPGTAMNIAVSTGPTSTTVPNVVGGTLAAAVTAVLGANLLVGNVGSAYDGVVAAGNIISQSPASGSTVSEGSAVDVTVSLGTAPATDDRALIRAIIRALERGISLPLTGA